MLMTIKEILKKEIGKAISCYESADSAAEAAASNQPEHGDYSSNIAMVLAKNLKKKPSEIAEEIKKELLNSAGVQKRIEKIEIAPPGFLNFFLKKEILTAILKDILKKKDKFGQSKKQKKTIVIEYSSPNIAKPLGAHHLRSTVIGQALVNILRFAGYRTISLSFPGDWGTQFGILIAAYKKWGDREKLKKDPINEMLDLYVRFSKAAKENPELKEEGRREFKKLEEGDGKNLKLWKWFLGESMKEFERVYKMLGIKIEHTIGESFYEPKLKGVIEDAFKKGVAQKNEDGSVIIRFKDSPPELIQKSDGSSIYTTRELAAIKHRMKHWKADKIIYVADNGQSFHLEQVFRAADLLRYAEMSNLFHVKFGVMLGQDGKKFATREGKLIPLEKVLKEAIDRARKIVEELNQKLSKKEKDKISRVVGVGAVKFADLRQNRVSDIIFDWDKMLNLKGNSAPYIQYTYARIKSILRKAKKSPKNFDLNFLRGENEFAILRHLIHFPEIITSAAERFLPNIIAEYILRLCEKLNVFYETTPVLKAEKSERMVRLALISAGAIVIKNSCALLGIETPGRM
ncbi:MAG: arginine--tRNA ligase [Candidatus Tagabacteria bacterium RIFCSPLOWO2_01_FULL_39_11]|uniref:Arginine--tRNA ligase n=1 Tax=Candidatus Tagabacteria bacterium RIFCSPLOWO2_01_FULL_39_11 TaxID=1802295 RepID=A0A1G2LQ93_9BACT|nr:MAG: arginine--tRNA ligase [Candidatus Tagabacteria bacterium RIFCSPLOWO2_01_FULL_39_11]